MGLVPTPDYIAAIAANIVELRVLTDDKATSTAFCCVDKQPVPSLTRRDWFQIFGRDQKWSLVCPFGRRAHYVPCQLAHTH